MAEQADAIFHSNLSALSCSNAWLGILAYTLQIYFDFSGYSDMAIGLGRIMGFKFPENFDSPYTARSISEFWQRWHITLGSFMREYLYIPLGGNRVKSKLRLYLNLSIVFLLSGLWHGASWNFVLWGAYHGLFQILDRTFLIKLMNRLGAFPSVIITFLTVMIGWVIFRLENVGQIVVYLTQLFSFSSQQESLSIPAFWPLASFALVCSFLVLTSIGKRLDAFIFHQNSYALTMHCVLSPLALLFIFLCTCSITASDFNPFIYFRF
jgi:alginate O-acetyltransferase complex protein AlgI